MSKKNPTPGGRPKKKAEVSLVRSSAAEYLTFVAPIHHLAPQGMAGFVLANGSMSSNQSGEGDIRRALIDADLVDCMVALPGQLFYSTQIPVCLWFFWKNETAGKCRAVSELELALAA